MLDFRKKIAIRLDIIVPLFMKMFSLFELCFAHVDSMLQECSVSYV